MKQFFILIQMLKLNVDLEVTTIIAYVTIILWHYSTLHTFQIKNKLINLNASPMGNSHCE